MHAYKCESFRLAVEDPSPVILLDQKPACRKESEDT